MISESIIDAIIKQATIENKDNVLKMFIKNLRSNYYNDTVINRVLELLINPKCLVKKEHINMDCIIKNFSSWLYQPNNLIVKDITLSSIDNIEGLIHVSYKYKEKINEDRDDIDFINSIVSISFIDNPEVLKNS